jgi:hypothetical protein
VQARAGLFDITTFSIPDYVRRHLAPLLAQREVPRREQSHAHRDHRGWQRRALNFGAGAREAAALTARPALCDTLPMARIGPKDAFEQDYTERFRSILKGRGVFVQYEHDRAARDIGVHFTKSRPDGGRNVTAAFAWFQLKGIMATTMSAGQFREKTSVSYLLYVEDLQFWYLQPAPTYLGLYIESAGDGTEKLPKLLAGTLPPQQSPAERGRFLILNLKKYVEERWGRTIFDLGADPELHVHAALLAASCGRVGVGVAAS